MKEAIQQTIDDFRIALANCSWYQFRLMEHYTNQIKHYEEELLKLNQKQMNKLRPINNHVLVEPVKKAENKTAAGIIIPDVNTKESRKRLDKGVVRLVGNRDPDIAVINEGETVYYAPGTGLEVLIEDKTYLVIPIVQLKLVLEV